MPITAIPTILECNPCFSDTLEYACIFRMRSPTEKQKKKLMSQPPIEPTPEQPNTPEPPAAPEPPQFAPPTPPAAPSAPDAPQYAPPVLPSPPAPQQPSYAPQPPHFAPPQAPQQPQFGPPQTPQYGQPGVPQQPYGHQQPPAPQYGQPAAPQYGQPADSQQPYGGQPAPQYGQPAAPQYGQPGATQQPYGQPAYGQPAYGAPAYGAPAYGGQMLYAPAPPGTVPGPGGPFDGAVDPDDLTRPLYGATFMQSIKRFFKQYANFSGRASRSEYWWVMLLMTIIQIIPVTLYIAGVVVMATSVSAYDSYGSYSAAPSGVGLFMLFTGIGLLVIIGLGLLIPSIAVAWRRLHDGNFAGPMYFLSLIPYAGYIILLVFTLLPPKAEGRRFDELNR